MSAALQTGAPQPFATAHAYAQLLDRYGVCATHEDWAQALLDVTGGNGLMVSRESDGRERWIVRVAGVAALTVYDPEYALFITALPPHRTLRRFAPPKEGAHAPL